MIPIALTMIILLVACQPNTAPNETMPEGNGDFDDTPDTPTNPAGTMPEGSGGDWEDTPDTPTAPPYSVSLDDGVLTYSIRVQAPTPCHEPVVQERIMESYPVQVGLDVTFRDSGQMCAQVITEKTVTGRITIDAPVSTVTITTPTDTFEVQL